LILQNFLIIIISSLIIALTLYYIIKLFFEKAEKLKGNFLFRIKFPLSLGIFLAGLELGLEDVKGFLPFSFYISNFFFVFWTLLATFIAFKLLDAIIYHLSKVKSLYSNIKPLSLLIKLVISITSLFIIFRIFNIDLAPYLLGWGLLGFAIVLALQPILADFLIGIYIALVQPYKIGDKIQLSSGEICEVIDIKSQRTLLLNLVTNEYIYIPNSELVRMRIISFSQSPLRLTIPIKISQEANLDEAKNLILEIVKKVPYILEDPPPSVYLTELSSSSLKLELIIWIKDPTQRYKALDMINSEVRKRFLEQGIKIVS